MKLLLPLQVNNTSFPLFTAFIQLASSLLFLIIIIIVTRRRLWSVATAPHDVHAPLHSATSVSSWLLFRRQSGRPGSLRQFVPEQRAAFIAMTCFKAWYADTLVSSLTTCPNSA